MFPSTSSRETLRLSGKQNSLFPSGVYIKCIMFRSLKEAFANLRIKVAPSVWEMFKMNKLDYLLEEFGAL